MTNEQVLAAIDSMAENFARQIGYTARAICEYEKNGPAATEAFILKVQRSGDLLEVTPFLGMEIHAIEELVKRAPGVERAREPTIGGPLFRFADLQSRSLHEFVPKIKSVGDLASAMAKIQSLWMEIGEPYIAEHRTSDAWLRAIKHFLEDNRIGGLKLPCVGRICIALKFASEGREAARLVLDQLRSKRGGKPVQDFAEAEKLFSQISGDPGILEPLKAAILRSKRH